MNNLKWTNIEKVDIKEGGESLNIHSKPKSDFWITPSRKVLDGSFGYETMSDDFSVSVHFIGDYKQQYDQAGLMLHISEDHWLKAGIELINGIQYVSAVVTSPYSDWSVVPTNLNNGLELDGITLRIEKKGRKVLIDYYFDSQVKNNELMPWTMLRKITAFTDEENTEVKVGIMTAAPQSDTGFKTTFSNFCVSKF